MIGGALTHRILGSAHEVHRLLGPGLLESAYRECLIRQLTLDGMKAAREVPISIEYKDLLAPGAFRADVVVDDTVLVELKAVERVAPVHQAQMLTYLRLSRLKVGLPINFNTRPMRLGIQRFVA